MSCRQKGIITGIHHQRGHGDIAQNVFCAGSVPIIIRIAVAMQGCGNDIIEFI